MKELFQECVNILKSIALMCDITYEEANIWIFVIIHPAITLILFTVAIKYYLKSRRNGK